MLGAALGQCRHGVMLAAVAGVAVCAMVHAQHPLHRQKLPQPAHPLNIAFMMSACSSPSCMWHARRVLCRLGQQKKCWRWCTQGVYICIISTQFQHDSNIQHLLTIATYQSGSSLHVCLLPAALQISPLFQQLALSKAAAAAAAAADGSAPAALAAAHHSDPLSDVAAAADTALTAVASAAAAAAAMAGASAALEVGRWDLVRRGREGE
jgi:hypothetical protein